MAYWQAVRTSSHKESGGCTCTGWQGKFTRADFTYKAPPKPNKELFLFLDSGWVSAATLRAVRHALMHVVRRKVYRFHPFLFRDPTAGGWF